jgi:hypothetical protein
MFAFYVLYSVYFIRFFAENCHKTYHVTLVRVSTLADHNHFIYKSLRLNAVLKEY